MAYRNVGEKVKQITTSTFTITSMNATRTKQTVDRYWGCQSTWLVTEFILLCASGGNEAIMKRINFTPAEFRQLFSVLESEVTSKWNTERGEESTFKPVNVLFTTLVLMNHETS